MAVEFKKLSAQWKTCEAKMAVLWGELDSAAQSEKNSKDLLEGGREDLIEKVFDAKRKGTTGTALADFIADAEVKKAWAGMQPTFKTIEAAHDRYQAAVKGFAPLLVEADDILKTTAAEVASRKKNKVFDSKSLPDLEKLHKEITADVSVVSQKHMRSVRDFAREKPKAFTLVKTITERIDSDIKSGVNRIKDNADDDTMLREFGTRSLAVAGAKMNDRLKDATGHCKAAIVAFKTGDKDTASAEIRKAIKIAEAAEEVTDHYGKTLKAKGNEIKDHKDGKVMLTKVNAMNATARTILTTVTKTQQVIT